MAKGIVYSTPNTGSGGAPVRQAPPKPKYNPYTAGAPAAGKSGQIALPTTMNRGQSNVPPRLGNKPLPTTFSRLTGANPVPKSKTTPAGSINPLAPMTPAEIQRQATKTVTASYKPDQSDINSQQSTARNLYAQQTVDDEAFSKWLATQSQTLSDKVDAINSKLLGVMQGVQQTQSAYLAAQPGQVAAGAGMGGSGATPGVNEAALARETAPAIGAAGAVAANAMANDAQQGIAAQQGAVGAGSVALARVAVQQRGALSGLNTALTNIASERTKLTASRTSDIQKEITRLQGVEISKAQWNRSEKDLEAKVNISKANETSQAIARLSAAQTASTNAATRAAAQTETARHAVAMERINSAHYADQNARAVARQQEIDHHAAVTEKIQQQNADSNTSRANTSATKAGTPTVPKPATPAQQRRVTNYLGQVRQALLTDIHRFHPDAPNALQLAYHDLSSGRAAKAGIRLPAAPNGANSVSYLNAAINTLSDYGAQGLTAGDVSFLKSQGLIGTAGYRVKGRAPAGPH